MASAKHALAKAPTAHRDKDAGWDDSRRQQETDRESNGLEPLTWGRGGPRKGLTSCRSGTHFAQSIGRVDHWMDHLRERCEEAGVKGAFWGKDSARHTNAARQMWPNREERSGLANPRLAHGSPTTKSILPQHRTLFLHHHHHHPSPHHCTLPPKDRRQCRRSTSGTGPVIP